MERERGPYYRHKQTVQTKRLDSFSVVPPKRTVRPQRPHITSHVAVEADRPQPSVIAQQFVLNMDLPGQPEKHGSRAFRDSRPKRQRRRLVRRAVTTAVAFVLLTGGGVFAKGYVDVHKSFQGTAPTVAALKVPAFSVDPNALNGEGSGRINILLMGKGGPGHDGPDLTDTMLIASIDPVNNTASLLSIPRDMWVNIPGYQPMKINAAYALAKYKAQRANYKDKAAAEAAGIKNVEGIVTQVTGLPIHYYTMVDFTAFKEAIDTVGGITVNVPEDLFDPTMAWENNNSPVLASKGTQSMNGTKALLYVRSRHTSSDFARTERQRIVLEALGQKILSAGTLSNPVKLSNLLDSFGSHVTTDLSIANAERLGNIMTKINLGSVESIGLADPPNNYVVTDTIGSQSIVRPVAGLDNYQAIQSFVRNKLKDGYIVKENAKVLVLSDGMHVAAAADKVNELKSYGYNVETGDALAGNYNKTKLVDLTAGKLRYTRHYLEERLNTNAAASLPDPSISAKGAQFVIIVGNDDATSNNQAN